MTWYQIPPSFTAQIEHHNAVQRRTFTRWINVQLKSHHHQLIDLSDLQDGVLLLRLLAALTGECLKPEKGRSRLHALANVRRVLACLAVHQVRVINIQPEDIVDGNVKLTLSLLWSIISHFYLPKKEVLLGWAREAAPGVRITDLTSSWRDGKALGAILGRYSAGSGRGVGGVYISDHKSTQDTLEELFTVAEKLGVSRLLEPGDVDCAAPDEKSMMTYIASLYRAFQGSDDAQEETDRASVFQDD